MRSLCLTPVSRVITASTILFSMVSVVHGEGLGVTSPAQISVPDGFEVELVYEVPSEDQGSWVSLTVDPKGRLVACDQYGGLYRIDLSSGQPVVEKLNIEFEGAQGLLCAFGSLYANVNSRSFPSGVWRLTDTDGDDQYDKKEHIMPLNGGSEHGPHAMLVTPDGKRIAMCAGNNTNLPDDVATSRVPKVWKEDHLLGRMPDARGHNANRMAPGGFVVTFDPDGGNVDLVATGFRNQYDIAYDKNGELFAYDADMEWDVGTPWYRPTRVNHVISGAEFGWRNGTGKWPAYYPDSFGSAVDIGPGSPTGITFAYDAKFPAKYKNALFISDWSYGNIHAVFLKPDGSSYTGDFETFSTGAPLPVTDLAVHPTEGVLYFTIGGRKAQSGLYRIRYSGSIDSVESVTEDAGPGQLRDLRHRIESLHVADSTESIDLAIENLGHTDRAIRFASRIALEHQPVDQWKQKALSTGNINVAVALARVGSADDRDDVIELLGKVDLSDADDQVLIDLSRAYALAFMRMGGDDTAAASDAESSQVIAQLDKQFPTGRENVDRELAQLLVFVNSPGITGRVVERMQASPSQESQIHYAMILRDQSEGWSDESRQAYFGWFNAMATARGGMSFGGFLKNIKDAAVKNLDEKTIADMDEVLNPPKASRGDAPPEVARDFVQKWAVSDLASHTNDPGRAFDFERGKTMFAAAQCYKCHRMGLQGGILGPDLTGAGGRFSVTDLLTSIVEPDKVISDQYGATQFLTDDGRVVVGRVINLREKSLTVMTNMLDPSKLTNVDRDAIEETQPAKTSMMPAGLLDTLSKEEVADLVAYLRAGGNANHPLFGEKVAGR